MLTWDTSNDAVKEGEDGGVVGTNRLIQLLPVKNNVVILRSDRGCTVITSREGSNISEFPAGKSHPT